MDFALARFDAHTYQQRSNKGYSFLDLSSAKSLTIFLALHDDTDGVDGNYHVKVDSTDAASVRRVVARPILDH